MSVGAKNIFLHMGGSVSRQLLPVNKQNAKIGDSQFLHGTNDVLNANVGFVAMGIVT